MIAHAVAAALLLAQATPAPPSPCITPQEAGAATAVALPEFIEALGQRCARHLPESAFLRAQGPALIQRWRSESAGHRDLAFAGARRMAPASARNFDPEVGLSAMVGGITGGMAPKLNAASCAELSRFVESLAPLPAGNVAQMVSALIGFGIAVGPPPGRNAPPICRP